MKIPHTPLAGSIASRFGSAGKSLAGAGLAVLLLATVNTPASGQLQLGVVNGGFETGNFTGWTQSGNTGFTGVGTSPHSGAFAASFGPVGSTGSITQNVPTFLGGTYTLAYFLQNGGGTPNSFSSKFNGVTLSSITNGAAQPYTQYTFSGLQVSSTSTPLVFTFRQDPSYWNLDDVSLTLNNLRNATSLSLGSVPATLPITNNFTQTSTGVLQLNIGGLAPSQHDLIAVGGTAILDGKLQLVRLNNFTFKRGDKITILTAGGGVSGEFASLAGNFGDTILSPIAVYGKNSVVLEVPTYAQFASASGLPPNERSVAGALDRVVSDPRANSLIGYLDNRSLSKLPEDFDRIAPEELAGIFNLSAALANVQTANLERRMDDLRAGASGFSASGFAMSGSAGSYGGGFAGPAGKSGKTLMAPAAEDRWGVFVTGVGEFTKIGDTANASGYDLTTGGFTLGVDYKLTPHFALGMYAGYARSGVDLNHGGRITVDGGKLGLYATYFAGGFYADAAVGGGLDGYTTRRSALLGDARGSENGGELNVLFATGYDWKVGALRFGPTASFQYDYTTLGSFTETGSLAPLHFGSQHADSLRSAFGARATYDWKVWGLLVRPEVRVSWQHEYGSSAYAVESSFANGAGGTFITNGPETARNSLLIGAGFAVQLSERISTYVYYDGEIGRANYDSHTVSGGLRVAF